jgi:DNA-binding MarR family transcriptional regulator
MIRKRRLRKTPEDLYQSLLTRIGVNEDQLKGWVEDGFPKELQQILTEKQIEVLGIKASNPEKTLAEIGDDMSVAASNARRHLWQASYKIGPWIKSLED